MPGLGAPEIAEDFFEAIFGRALAEHTGYIAVASADHHTGKFRQVFCASPVEAASIATDLYLERRDVYFGVQPYSRPSRKRRSIKVLVGLHVDADRLSRRAYERLLCFRPSIVIRSSSFTGSFIDSRHRRSFHGYFLFKEPVKIDRADAVVKLNRRLAEILQVDSGTADLTRVLRVPRTLNFKHPSDPQPVDIEVWEPSRRYAIEEIAEMLGVDLSAPEPAPGIASANALAAINPEGAHEERRRFLSSEQRLYVSKLLNRGLFEPSSRNKAQLLLTLHYYELGYSRDRIVGELSAFFCERSNGFSTDWAERPGWVVQNIERGVDNWVKKAARLPVNPAMAALDEPKALAKNDRAFIRKQRVSSGDKAFLTDAMTWLLNNKRGDRVIMPVRQMYKFRCCNERNYQSKRKFLYDLGIIELDVKHDRDTGLAYEYRVIYQFDTPATRRSKSDRPTVADQIERMILEGKTNAEIRRQLPGVSRQRVHSKRRTLDKQSRRIHQS